MTPSHLTYLFFPFPLSLYFISPILRYLYDTTLEALVSPSRARHPAAAIYDPNLPLAPHHALPLHPPMVTRVDLRYDTYLMHVEYGT